jgi:hypothetical protein
MNFNVKRNLQFTQLIKAEGRLREFNFTRHKPWGEQYFRVDVVDDRSNRIIFEMKHHAGVWQISETDLPQWITEHEIRFQQAIEEQLSHEGIPVAETESAKQEV